MSSDSYTWHHCWAGLIRILQFRYELTQRNIPESPPNGKPLLTKQTNLISNERHTFRVLAQLHIYKFHPTAWASFLLTPNSQFQRRSITFQIDCITPLQYTRAFSSIHTNTFQGSGCRNGRGWANLMSYKTSLWSSITTVSGAFFYK